MRSVQTLNETMRYVAGASLESTRIEKHVDDFRIRGYDAGSGSDNVTLDGIRAPQGGFWNRTMFDSWSLGRAEGLKGPSAVMYGWIVPGDIVNQVNTTPTPDQEQVLRLGGGSARPVQCRVRRGCRHCRQHASGATGRAVTRWRCQDRLCERKHGFVAPSHTWQADEHTRLTLLGHYRKDDGG